jgi:hypothetical protein
MQPAEQAAKVRPGADRLQSRAHVAGRVDPVRCVAQSAESVLCHGGYEDPYRQRVIFAVLPHVTNIEGVSVISTATVMPIV